MRLQGPSSDFREGRMVLVLCKNVCMYVKSTKKLRKFKNFTITRKAVSFDRKKFLFSFFKRDSLPLQIEHGVSLHVLEFGVRMYCRTTGKQVLYYPYPKVMLLYSSLQVQHTKTGKMYVQNDYICNIPNSHKNLPK
jgi:hypothetical protein